MATVAKDSMLKQAQNGSVRVEIFDQAYNLRGSDPEYILKLAEYVDSKMRAVAGATNTIDTVRLAVLAALNIADEYHLLKRRQESGATDYQKRAHILADALDEVLKENRKASWSRLSAKNFNVDDPYFNRSLPVPNVNGRLQASNLHLRLL